MPDTDSANSGQDEIPKSPELGGLDPGELLARGLNTVKPSGGAGAWEPPTPEDLGRLLPQYRIERLIGRGGMGAVYKGTQLILDRPVAIKLLPVEVAADEQFIARFHREARTLAKLQHSRIITVHDFGQTSEGHLYFVMEYIDGTNLREILRGPGLNPNQALMVVGQICDALKAAHSQGVIHRDIKPENILVTRDGYVKLADFGLARPLQQEDAMALTGTNIIMGTVDYMAPEQREGQTDARADIFALGVMLYEMLTGKPPRGAFEPASKKVRLDVRIDQVVLRALQSEPARRYQNVSEMKTDVERIQNTPVPAAPAAKPRVAVAPPARKRHSVLGPASVLAAILAIGAYLLWGWGGNSFFHRRESLRAAPSLTPSGNREAASKPASASSDGMEWKPEVPLFNGRDLSGWESVGDSWSVADGVINCRPSDDSSRALLWKGGVVSNFDFRCKFRFQRGLDKKWWFSGIQFRSRVTDPERLGITGNCADLCLDFGNTGNLFEAGLRGVLAWCGERTFIVNDSDYLRPTAFYVSGANGGAAKARQSFKPYDWNEYRVTAVGRRVQIYVNGFQTVDAVDETTAAPTSGVLGLVKGPVQFKDVTLRELAGAAPSVESSPLPREPAPRASGVKSTYIRAGSASLKSKGYRNGRFPVMDDDDPNRVFESKPVYFDIHSGTKMRYEVESPQPLTELCYTGVAFFDFRIEIEDMKGAVIAASGPYLGGNNLRSIRMPLPKLTHFVVALKTAGVDWVLAEDLHFGSSHASGAAPPVAAASAKATPSPATPSSSITASKSLTPPPPKPAASETLANPKAPSQTAPSPVPTKTEPAITANAHAIPPIATPAASPVVRRAASAYGSYQEEALLGHNWSWIVTGGRRAVAGLSEVGPRVSSKTNDSIPAIQFFEDGRMSTGWHWQWLPKPGGELLVDCFWGQNQHAYLKFNKQFSEFEIQGGDGSVIVRGTRLTPVGQNVALSVTPAGNGVATSLPATATVRSSLTSPPTSIPAVMGARLGENARAQALMRNGGTKESEEAVLRGLHWLVGNQNPDGSWGPGNKGAMTGFALLSFLGHGETNVSPEFGKAVQKALDWLTQNGARNEGRLSMSMAFNAPGVYEHAIATFALAEYYAMTRDERVANLLKRAVGYIVDGQSPDGGWVYGYSKQGDGDTSVTGWQIQALKAAYLTGLEIPGVAQALDKAMLDLKRVQGSQGGFGYRTPGNGYPLAGVGVFGSCLWKQERDQSVRNGIQFILAQTDKDYPIIYQGQKANIYSWYYDTQACFMVGGSAWQKWNRLFQAEITRAQAPDGSWPVMKAKGVGDIQTNPSGIGPFYRTNLCILMLEVYYRYLPGGK